MGAYLNVNNVQNQEKYVLFFAQIVDRKVKKQSKVQLWGNYAVLAPAIIID